MSRIMEIVSFRTTGGQDAFVAASKEIDAWVQDKPGFVSRQLVSTGDDAWMDIVLWENLGQAKDAAETFGEELGSCAAVKLIVGDSVTIVHAPLISSSTSG